MFSNYIFFKIFSGLTPLDIFKIFDIIKGIVSDKVREAGC